MRWVSFVLIVATGLLQYSFWLGKGGWLKVQELQRQEALQKVHNSELLARNAALEAEVNDLKQGFDAIEERARNELGMIKPQEIWFHFVADVAQPVSRPADVLNASRVNQISAEKNKKSIVLDNAYN